MLWLSNCKLNLDLFSLIVPWKRVTSFAHIGKENHDSRKATDRNQAKSVSHFQ